MSISIIWSLTNGGAAVDEPVNLGNINPGSSSTIQRVYFAHNGDNPIMDCALYMGEYSGTYAGANGPVQDYAELIDWADTTVSGNFGGLAVNMDATGNFSSSWPAFWDKTPSHGLSHLIQTGVGDTIINAVEVPSEASSEMTVSGEVPADMTEWPSFQLKIDTPINANAAVRQMDLRLRFKYTS